MNKRIIELNRDKLEDVLRRAEAKQFNDEDYDTVKALVDSYAYLTELVADETMTTERLLELVLGPIAEQPEA